MAKFEKAIEKLEYMRRCELATFWLGGKQAFGATQEDSDKAKIESDELQEAIEILRRHQ